MAEQAPAEELSIERIYKDFARAARWQLSLQARQRENNQLISQYYGVAKVAILSGDLKEQREVYARPEAAEYSRDYFANLAIMKTLEQDLDEAERQLSKLAIGRAVKVMPNLMRQGQIRQTALAIWPDHHQESVPELPKLPALGTIAAVKLRDNNMLLRPRNFSMANAAEGFLVFPVVDQSTGQPLVDIEFRRPTFRDKPAGWLLKALDIVTKPSIPGHDTP